MIIVLCNHVNVCGSHRQLMVNNTLTHHYHAQTLTRYILIGYCYGVSYCCQSQIIYAAFVQDIVFGLTL